MSGADPVAGLLASRSGSGAFLLVDKPVGPSSHQVTAWVRALRGLGRAGHAGTRAPGVSGLLWVGLGRALRLVPLVLEFPKRYVGVIVLHGPASDADVARVLQEFTGPVYQTPPVRSAVRRARRVRTIHRLELLERRGPALLVQTTTDSGTYVRTIAVDVGEALGTGAHLAELRRTGTGPFGEDRAVTMTSLADAVADARGGGIDRLTAMLHGAEEVWKEFPVLALRASAAAAVAHGADLAAGGIAGLSRAFSAGSSVALVAPDGRLVAVGRALVDSRELPRRRSGWVVDAGPVLLDPEEFPLAWRHAEGTGSRGA